MIDNKQLTIWGRDFDLPVVYHSFPGEEVITNQIEAAERIDSVDFEMGLNGVKKYILKRDADIIDDDQISNPFRFVKPKKIHIPYDENNRLIAILCDYKFDMEHGIAIVYENEKFKEVGPQDIAL